MKITIDELSENKRIDLFLSEILTNISRSKIQSCIKNGKCFVNQKPIKSSYLVKLGDVVEYNDIVEDIENIYPAEDIPIEIVWEDENMAVVNKPSGMLTHPTNIEKTGTLVNVLLYKYGDNLSDINGLNRRGIVHRLDRNTSGLIMIAKNNKTHEYLAQQIKDRAFTKKYIAIVKGNIEKDEFDIDLPIGRHFSQPQKMSTAKNAKDLKESLTKVKVIERLKNATLVELTLITGRTHQIRVHMASIGHPVYNDTLYGFGKIKVKTDEQVLQSYKLKFIKPFTKKEINLEIPYDSKVKRVLEILRSPLS